MKPTEKHREEAREPERIRVCVRAGHADWIGVAYATETADPSAIHEYVSAATLSARDAEIREVLEGLSVFVFDGDYCWCQKPTTGHWDYCLDARALYTKLQPAKESSDGD